MNEDPFESWRDYSSDPTIRAEDVRSNPRTTRKMPPGAVEKARGEAAKSIDAKQPSSAPSSASDRAEPVLPGPWLTDVPRTAQFGWFRILGYLGRGGGGVVYHAYDERVRREVALKVPPPDCVFDEAAEQRFQREAHAAAALDHPNIVTLYEAGQIGRERYIASAYCRGISLANWLTQQRRRNQPIDPKTAARWTAELADALAHAHAREIVHRDLKPGNVILEPVEWQQHDADVTDDHGSVLRPKITDFGVAKLLESETVLTHTGSVIGTPAYMSPEQAEGRLAEIGPATDIYGLGAMLYELLTGRPPIQGVNGIDTLRRVTVDDPEPIRRLRLDVPPALEAICLKCLEKQPKKRYSSASELGKELERFLADQPVRTRRVGRVGRTWRQFRRQHVSAFSVVLVLLAMLAVLAAGNRLFVMSPQGQVSPSASAPASAEQAGQIRNISADRDRQLEADYFQDMILASRIWEDNSTNLRNSTTAARDMARLLEPHFPRPGRKDRRGFEWYYLWDLCHPQERQLSFPQKHALRGHTAKVFGVRFSPSGRLIATASADGTARIWDAGTGELQHVLSGHTDDVNTVVFSPDETSVATASDDRTVRLYRTEDGIPVATLTGHTHWVCDIAFSPDGSRIASGDNTGVLKIWDVESSSLERTVHAHSERIMALAYSPNGRWLATASDEGRIKVWSPNANEMYQDHTFYSLNSDPSALCFSHSSKWLAVGGRDLSRSDPEMIILYDVERARPIMTLGGHQERIHGLDFSPDDLTLFSLSEDKQALAWDLTTRVSLKPIERLPGPGWALDLSPDGRLLATAGEFFTVPVWDASAGLHRTTVAHVSQRVAGLQITPDGTSVAAGFAPDSRHERGLLRLWDTAPATPRLVHEEPVANAPVVCFSNDGSSLAFTSRADTDTESGDAIRILDLASRRERLRIDKLGGQVRQIHFGKDDQSLLSLAGATSANNWSVALWNTADGSENHSFIVPPPLQHALTVSPNGTFLAGVCDFGIGVHRLSAEGAADPRYPFGPGSGLPNLKFSADDRYLAAASSGNFHVWDSLSTAGPTRYSTGTGPYLDLAFSPDGRLIAVALSNQIVLIDLANGQQMLSLPMPRNTRSISELAFSADNRAIIAAAVAADGDTTIHIWRGRLPTGHGDLRADASDSPAAASFNRSPYLSRN